MAGVRDSSQIEQKMKELRGRQYTVSNELDKLVARANFTYLDTSWAKLTGTTKTEAVPTLREFTRWREAFGHIGSVLRQADKIKKDNLILTEGKRKEMEDLVFGESISIVAENQVDPARTITPEDFLNEFAPAIKKMSAIVDRVETANDKLGGLLDQAKADVKRLESLGASLGFVPPDLASLQTELQNLQAQFVLDPLGTSASFTQGIAPRVDSVRQKLEAMKAQLNSLSDLLKNGDTTLAGLRTLQQQCTDKMKECRGAIKDPPVQKRRGDLIRTIEASLNQAKQSKAAGDTAAALAAMSAFSSDAEAFRLAEQAALDAYTAMLDERLELRERLKNYQVRAVRHKVAERKELQDLASQAESILYHRPDVVVLTPLPEARRLVEQYRVTEEQLSAAEAK